ncbi:glycosyltransferase [Flavobacterium chungbukense]|uniref:Glycosyltransferase family 2 protein n=1 Tax=Flavobacterium chungbukense TaxID=877464 RepID=A0ABP7XJW1_9FLAO|nr:glycosyltransferase [Flavobacterium chungbukense]MCC4922967.1 glycosyltransferase [Flavobacterium chungbukense]
MVKVDILMATYNGELYVKSQILSLQAQTFQNWRLLIHDDGSTDNTISILKQIASTDSRIVILEDTTKFGNAAENFTYLLNFSNAEYLMYCDQDDIWFDNKIECQLQAISKKNNKIPQVVYSNSYVWIPEEGIKGLATLTFPKKINQLLFLNSGMQGCSAIFNGVMRELLVSYKGKLAMHDHLLHLSAICLGEVEYLEAKLMLYRNHEKNVTGATSVSTMDVSRILKNTNFPVVDRHHYEAIFDFYQAFKAKLEMRDQMKVKIYLEMVDYCFFKKLFLVLKEDYQLFGSKLRLLSKITLRSYIN